MKKEIAFFDLDGTITSKDTFLEFIRFAKGSFSFYLGFLLNMPYLVAFKLKFISNQKAKERILTWFFRGTSEKEFVEICDRFSTQVLPGLVRSGALVKIREFQDRGVETVVVSASAEDWIGEWCVTNRLSMIATKLERKTGKLTGRIDGKNCHGIEKVRRIREKYHLQEYHEIYAFGDSGADRPMLDLASYSSYKPFREGTR